METNQCIKRGMGLLDLRVPDWQSRVNVSKLDMCSNIDGLLEQLFGEYGIGLGRLSLTYADAARYGFDIVGNDGDNEANVASWKQLTIAWKEALKPVVTIMANEVPLREAVEQFDIAVKRLVANARPYQEKDR